MSWEPIQQVWEHNLDTALAQMTSLIEEYPYVAFDTEFPGIVTRPVGSFKSTNDFHYKTLKCNVDLLKIIQVGITLMDHKGRVPKGTATWQFNFKFSLAQDLYAPDAIELLQRAGIDFSLHEQKGIDPKDFAEMLTVSGLVLSDDVRWISFHGGFDFGYLLKMLTGQDLPDEEPEFFNLLSYFFPRMYDIKHMMKNCSGLFGGLQKLAGDLNIQRIGVEHQAGSDALLTGAVFFALKEKYFGNKLDDEKVCRLIYGLGDYSLKVPMRIGF
jgi:CCR4-NOT transcription complex subunit 7/8